MLCVIVPIVLIAIAAYLVVTTGPAFNVYINREKTAEVHSRLTELYRSAATYYEETDHCVVGPAVTTNVPGPEPTEVGPMSAEFEALGFAVPEATYFQYEIVSNGPSCGNPPDKILYSFVAHGDLDGDGVRSRFELVAGTDANNVLFRLPGFHMENDIE